MAFRAGNKLGPYEFLAPIGSGGMGEVYKARDVAIKVLPAALVQTWVSAERKLGACCIERRQAASAAFHSSDIVDFRFPNLPVLN
jgi:hypothetical protein